MADVLATFVDSCVKNIEGTGGQVAKFITGMAYWPINRAEDALLGIQAISDELAELRAHQPPGSALSLVYSRAGVHYGRALLCNAGAQKSDFTLLGDCINTASRVASLSLSVQLKVPLLFSFEVRCLLGDDMREELESLGMHKVKGRDKPVAVYQFAGAQELDSAMVKQKIDQFNPGRYRAMFPVWDYESLPLESRPPIFDDTPKVWCLDPRSLPLPSISASWIPCSYGRRAQNAGPSSGCRVSCWLEGGKMTRVSAVKAVLPV